jgi:hypothetical protein
MQTQCWIRRGAFKYGWLTLGVSQPLTIPIYRRYHMRFVIMLVLVVVFWASNAGAGCKEDCDQDHKRAVEECQTTYNNPENKQPDQLQECLDQAEADYKSCLDQCKDEWDTHEE